MTLVRTTASITITTTTTAAITTTLRTRSGQQGHNINKENSNNNNNNNNNNHNNTIVSIRMMDNEGVGTVYVGKGRFPICYDKKTKMAYANLPQAIDMVAGIGTLNQEMTECLEDLQPHIGGLGSFAVNLLFSPHDSPIVLPPPTPSTAYNFKHQPALIAHDVAFASSLHVAHHATREWCKTHPTTRFGQTYHTMTPQQWALQSLSLNISHALGKYLQGALTDLSNAKSVPTHTSHVTFYGPTPFSFPPHAPVLTAAAPHTLHARSTHAHLR
jgi:hypothetical protein